MSKLNQRFHDKYTILELNDIDSYNLDVDKYIEDIFFEYLNEIINKTYSIIEWIYSIYDLINISPTVFSILYDLFMILPVLIAVAFVTVAERKAMGSMQRRLGPNITGVWGTLQAFADALKLILKENVSPTQANLIFFWFGPVITLVFSLLGFAVIPFGPGLAVLDFSLGILYLLAVSSVATYGILMAGWSANSKYAFLGALRSTAQLISYELILSSAILLVILFSGSLNLTEIIEDQIHTWYVMPMIPIFIIFLIGALAETNRSPMDLAEAESELVSGFFTEHSSVPFVSFFLAEYGSILLMSIITTVLFLGGYNLPFFLSFKFINDLIWILFNEINSMRVAQEQFTYFIEYNPVVSGMLNGFVLGTKTCFIVFCFVWVRASMPRIRYDQLMQFCWTVLLPILFAFIFLFPCILYSFDSLAVSF